MLRGHYLRLFLLRLLFVPWILWLLIGGFLVAVFILSGGPVTFIILYILSIPFHFFFILPFYTMVHAVLYSEIR